MDTRKRIKIDDVAAAAGVSPATVSRAINNPHMVRGSVRARILELAENMGYSADGAARALATRRSQAVGAIIPTLDNAMFARIIDGLQRHLYKSNYMLLLASSDYDPEKEFRNARVMLERSVDGLMIVGAVHDPRLYKLLEASGVPFVQTLAPARASPHPSIGYDSDTVAQLVVGYLRGLGHRDFGLVVGHTAFNDRVAAYIESVRKVLDSFDIKLAPDRVLHRQYTVEEGGNALQQLVRQGPLPSAIIAGNDTLAFGLIHEAQLQGLSIPGDLSIVGLGDSEFAANLPRPLTTVRTPKSEIGRLAADYLLGRIENRTVNLPGEMQVELVVRSTTGRPAVAAPSPAKARNKTLA
ncbi:substrate-binding domain-containing protein [Roseiarcaceae bacterium H3SJ34-1]|uniref:LacI family DNA-binding transcriptional regulator n=1 Tax=Terripilifer ovatus TaxID=3032367 RepID=UPI003AB951EA|nr:substrate-binding domain-containing protein [Roseiarcaceae bacterium H3SJ34-1]